MKFREWWKRVNTAHPGYRGQTLNEMTNLEISAEQSKEIVEISPASESQN